MTKQTWARLDDLVAWQEADEQLAEAESEHEDSLGAYYRGRDNIDFEHVRRAVEVAEQAIDLAAGIVSRDALVEVLSRGTAPPAAIASSAAETSISTREAA